MSIIYKGEIVKISGPVIDVRFSGKLPPINTLLTIEEADKHIEENQKKQADNEENR